MISIIIPAFNEASCIGNTIRRIKEIADADHIREVIVVDGGSTDETLQIAARAGAKAVISPIKGRSAQMNYGASLATAEVLYFLHADTLPPEGFSHDILSAVAQGQHAGCFMLAFDHPHWFLQANCWFTRFDFNYFRFGDQSLFVAKDVFLGAGGFCERHIVMEDQEIIQRIRKLSPFTVIRKPVLTSSRKYLQNGIYRTQAIFFLIFFMYQLGFSQQKLVHTYRKLIRQDKV
ncbi:TIGR04283 family arsenosugar biosynthesis glycosyltransferase [Pedobacter sp. SYSU D00535]|uniref:TIGR04283 family arsenosugar biosynthesis glycosyltransferase n=1 Tax=Pedobacter sp. SYSU D00535 TaxID=2810308 RepID=UPI001A976DC6|nr:TIGR04283 family arsenosugar biosynthesis glycosyltransferase [Pedobacter sp. SYSU D00535]